MMHAITKAGKYNHGKFGDDGTTHSIPAPLARAFEAMILHRQMLGEENDSIFAQNLLLDLVRIWNENIVQLREEFAAAMGGKALEALDCVAHQGQESEASDHVMNALKETLAEMKTIVVEKTPGALKFLGRNYVGKQL